MSATKLTISYTNKSKYNLLNTHAVQIFTGVNKELKYRNKQIQEMHFKLYNFNKNNNKKTKPNMRMLF